MIPLELDGDNLGEKHQLYNRLLKEALIKKNIKLTPNFKECGDIENLLKIDVACINKNVNFILEVLKCEDMLYVSRVVKRSTWLITEPEHAHIINIDYLKTHIFPYMTTRAINKLMLSIRIHIKDEKRADQFFEYEAQKNNMEKALKWLPQCSMPFIERTVAKHTELISLHLNKRLCERSITALEVYINHNNQYLHPSSLTNTLFLTYNNTERYLNIIEKLYYIPSFGRKHTKVLMKVCPQKILNNFEKFLGHIDYATCAKYMKREDIKSFLLKQASNEKVNYRFLKYYYIKHFLQRLPKESQLELIIQLKFISTKTSGTLRKEDNNAHKSASNYEWTLLKNDYEWYKIAPFDVAFRHIKKLIRTKSSPVERNSMLATILYCAGNNSKNIHTLLKYYYENHINEPLRFKVQFIEGVLKNLDVLKNKEIWSIINRLFCSMEVYNESTNDNIQKIIDVIIIYNAINKIPNLKIIEDKFSFSTLKEYKNKLLPTERENVFEYLFNNVQKKMENISITEEICYNELVTLMNNILELLNDWEKKLDDYPFIIKKIKELIAIKREKLWDSDLSTLYHVNKIWRKYLFEESIILSPSESVCINALKHGPSLLSRYKNEIQDLFCNNSMPLKTVFNKLRIYWPLSLTSEWSNFYFQQLDNPNKHKTAIKVLMIILPPDQLEDFIIKYAPENTKINWGAINELSVSLRKYAAKNMHLSRPLLAPEMVLLYAKGDYLQYCVPALNSILSSISSNHSGPIVQKLLTAPVSLQKYGIRLAFSRLGSKDLKLLFSKMWLSTTNATIRAIIFQKTHDFLCNNTNIDDSEDMWELLVLTSK
ncbi:uncharacterized protein LOC115441313 isoform X3 [Manduca sexta]|uniref:Uncharacterized protein n=1 Tax=Manduca sexta TaxID=7130 RepID=A0A922CHB9_MANSE|nr:uncharacterized protein LOC115441313 isoform X3 [Manduca sexta]KAG6446825.1 hypothetical protein O3G_MSEX004630 [Manduca sexta]